MSGAPRQSRIPAGGGAPAVPPGPELTRPQESRLCAPSLSNLLLQPYPPTFPSMLGATQHPASNTFPLCSSHQVKLLLAVSNLDSDKFLALTPEHSLPCTVAHTLHRHLLLKSCLVSSSFSGASRSILHLTLFPWRSPLHLTPRPKVAWLGWGGPHRGEGKWESWSLSYHFSENICMAAGHSAPVAVTDRHLPFSL